MRFEYTSMDELSNEDAAKKAISHVLKRIRNDKGTAHVLGVGTESFSLLTEAASKLYGEPIVKLREHFAGFDK